MINGLSMIEDTDMPSKMQIQAMAYASEALDLFDVLDCKYIAAHIKKLLDRWEPLKTGEPASSPNRRFDRLHTFFISHPKRRFVFFFLLDKTSFCY
ncbi:unnamed protein product [Trifolium pratense]|uniref:Uncharacterized protein n=1 Tax=Trifolium pratense TaxID=57577 RepID=A0ACB0LCX4_TRIPR|nr:unnamed protein product [Trifolium pratense]